MILQLVKRAVCVLHQRTSRFTFIESREFILMVTIITTIPVAIRRAEYSEGWPEV
jgi:hypothetical protein